jgi:hypothetical protein
MLDNQKMNSSLIRLRESARLIPSGDVRRDVDILTELISRGDGSSYVPFAFQDLIF